MSKTKELNLNTNDQLEKLLHDYAKESMNLRFQLKYATITNTSRIKIVRKNIAKIKTLLNNRRLIEKKAGVNKNA